MRFSPEIRYHDNRGLELAREILLPVLEEHPGVSHSDVWVLAGYEAVEALNGPHIEMAWGRIDVRRAAEAPRLLPLRCSSLAAACLTTTCQMLEVCFSPACPQPQFSRLAMFVCT